MADQWYYAQGSERKGPIDGGALKALADAGVVSSDTLVWREGMAGWEPAFRHVAGLVPAMPGRAPARGGTCGGAHDYFERVGMGEAFKRFWRNYVNFSGRSNRGEYWWAVLAPILLSIVVSIVNMALFGVGSEMQPLSALLSLATLLPSLSLAVRRLHDIDRTGWWILAPLGLVVLGFLFLIPMMSQMGTGIGPSFPVGATVSFIGAFVMVVVLFVWYCQRGTDGPNRFG